MTAKLIECKGPNCKEVKGASNHWLLVSPEAAEYFTCVPYDPKTKLKGFRPICGHGCATKVYSLWLTRIHKESFDIPEGAQQQLFSAVQDLDSGGGE